MEAGLARPQIMQYFDYAHLPPHLQAVSQPFFHMAQAMQNQLPECEQKTLALQKLLEAKDCSVRAALFKERGQ